MTGRGFQFGLVCMVMAALSGLVGFVVVYHYATFERPLQRFAIVIDAGSTQTRSSLFTIGVDVPKLARWTTRDEMDTGGGGGGGQVEPLSELLQVREVSTCVNGAPLAAIKSNDDARGLVKKCLNKFSQHIKRLDFVAASGDDVAAANDDGPDASEPLDSDEVAEQLAVLNHRVNSITHLYLGATAGMRALRELSPEGADEKLHLINRAINESSNSTSRMGPYVNKGFVGIIEGSDEAAFGWVSVNFVCDRLNARSHSSQQQQQQTLLASSSPHYTTIGRGDAGTDDDYHLRRHHYNRLTSHQLSAASNQDHSSQPLQQQQRQQQTPPLANSVGTLELGGASTQMAFQLADSLPAGAPRNSSLKEHNLDLFNGKYKLATRSDLCLGMSQAILRTNFLLLREATRSVLLAARPSIEVVNPCMQNGAVHSYGQSELGDILRAPCLVGSQFDTGRSELDKLLAATKPTVRFTGTGNAEQCDKLLTNLVEPELCKRYFSLCPVEKNRQPPPKGMPFVTISGYNKALQVLDLNKRELSTGDSEENRAAEEAMEELEQRIADKLGGYSIDYLEFIDETRKFCAVDVSEFPNRFPKMNKNFYAINCLQLVYINKLLTEFYHFDPLASWHQIKFLLFPMAPKQSNRPQREAKNDIGWTLGLLLNATSAQFSSQSDEMEKGGWGPIYYHHGASVLFLLRSTLFFMFACVLLAVSLLAVAVFTVRDRQRRGLAYISHSQSHSESSINQTT